MELSIIVTNYKNPELLKICLDSIKKSSLPESCEIIVSDSETIEDTELMMREDFPEIIFLPSKENIGFSGTVNRGLAKCQGEFILILNGDMIMKKDSIRILLDFIKDRSDVGIVGPQLLNFNDTLQNSCCRFYSPLTIIYRRTFLGNFSFAKKHLDRFLMKDFDHQSIKEVDWLMGSALMTRKETVKKIGKMDEKFKLYFEDVDWCRRFWENGYKIIYNPQSKMYHYHGRGSAGKNVFRLLISNKLAWIHILSGIRYFWKFRGKPVPKHN